MKLFKPAESKASTAECLTPRQQRQQAKAQKAYWFCWGLFAVAAVVVTFTVVTAAAFYGIDRVSSVIAAARPWFTLWRLLVFTLLIGYWSFWIGWLARWADMDPERIEFALSLRWRVAIWLLIIEIILVQRVAADFLDLLYHSTFI